MPHTFRAVTSDVNPTTWDVMRDDGKRSRLFVDLFYAVRDAQQRTEISKKYHDV